MSVLRPLAGAATAAIAVLACAATLVACGAGDDGAIVRIDGYAVTRAMVDSQMAALAPRGVALEPPRFKRCVARLEAQSLEPLRAVLLQECRERYRALRLRALDSLIASRWLVAEAARRGLHTRGGDTAAAARAAESALRRTLGAQAPKVTRAQAQAYYDRNIARYERRERRYIDIVERIPTRRAARASLNDVKRRGDMHRVAWHEVFDREDFADVIPRKRAILEAIFAAAPHTIVGPLPLNEQWCYFEVTRAVPRAVKPFVAVRPSIERRLAREGERARLTTFIAGWRRRWTARTHCSPGYVVQKCSEYRGPREAEPPTSFS